MKKMLIIIATVWLVLGVNYGVSAWIYVPDQGDTGWQTYTYTAGPAGFTGTAGFVVSNVIDNYAYSELLLDNLSQGGGGTNRGFESVNLSGYDVLPRLLPSPTSYLENLGARPPVYYPTEGDFLADLDGIELSGLIPPGFHNATGQVGTVGAIHGNRDSPGPGSPISLLTGPSWEMTKAPGMTSPCFT